MIPLFTTLALATASSWAGGLYCEDGLTRRSVDKIRKERRELGKQLDELGLELELITAAGEHEVVSPRSERVWDGTVVYLRDTLMHHEEGIERDVVLYADSQRMQTLTVRWEPGAMQVVQGRPQPPLLPPGPEVEELEATYGLELAGSWDPVARGVLAAALETLTDQERRALSDLRVHRLDGPSYVREGMLETVAGQYFGDGEGELGPRIELYDRAVQPSVLFVGPAREPVVHAVQTMVHELAHAIDHAASRRLRLAARPVRERLATYREQLTAQIAAGATDEELAELRTVIGDEQAHLASLTSSPWHDARLATPAWREAVGDEPAPTTYGRQADSEGFAELFALARLDPEAAQRVSPVGTEWVGSEALQQRIETALDEVEQLVGAPARAAD